MFDNPPFEIPPAVRDLAEHNVDQARSAYGQFIDMARQAQEMMTKSQGAVTSGLLEVQARALTYAEQNIDATFSFATDLARARDIKEFMEIQSRFAQRQMQAYTQQAQELARLMTLAAGGTASDPADCGPSRK